MNRAEMTRNMQPAAEMLMELLNHPHPQNSAWFELVRNQLDTLQELLQWGADDATSC